MYCVNCGMKIDDDSRFCSECGRQIDVPTVPVEPDWDSFQYDDETALTQAEVVELYDNATDEEVEEEFDLINAIDEGPEYYRKVLAIIRWRRANGQ